MSDSELTYKIIGCAMRVHRELGPGLREKPYENAMVVDLEEQDLDHVQQPKYPILYHGKLVGDCNPDIVVESTVVVDAKSIEKIGEMEVAQMLNYLRIAKLQLGLVLNFRPPKLEIKRVSL